MIPCIIHSQIYKCKNEVGCRDETVPKTIETMLQRGAILTKWPLRHLETPVALSVSLFDSLGECICSKGSSSIGYRVDWYNVYSQTNSSVGLMKKSKRWRKLRLPCITVAVYFSYFGSVVMEHQRCQNSSPRVLGVIWSKYERLGKRSCECFNVHGSTKVNV